MAERDYKKEYKRDHASPEAKKDRAARNTARREAEAKGQVRKGDGKEVDHIKALSKGGSRTDPGNRQILTQKANRQKGAR